ncbi:MAG: DUF1295 domain-containing protein [Anaerolineae bacterium]|nr:DUF1295 domain-containing protein [Anaerolineae bacterium]
MLEQLFAPISPVIVVLFLLALAISSIGFRKTVWFISIGYVFSITAMIGAVVLIFREQLTLVTLLQNAVLLVWSLRLGFFVIRREGQTAYQAQVAEQNARINKLPIFVKAAIWISSSLLYVAMFSPSLFTLTAPAQPTGFALVVAWIGIAIQVGGLLMEWVADEQKSAFKLKSPGQFCNVGLYRLVRCPNYLGEIMVWIGLWVVGASIYSGIIQWALSTVGLVLLVMIMMGSTKRLEKGQNARYGHLAEYQAYTRSVPVLFPFIPVYTLEKVRVAID